LQYSRLLGSTGDRDRTTENTSVSVLLITLSQSYNFQLRPEIFIMQRRKRLHKRRTMLIPVGLAVLFQFLHAWDIGCSLERTTGYRPGIVGRGITREILTVHTLSSMSRIVGAVME
jgi:uncharacterized membrane protein YozB (DUF420 family)